MIEILLYFILFMGIFAVMFFPAYESFIKRDPSTATQALLRQLAMAGGCYNIDNSGYTATPGQLLNYGFRPNRNVAFFIALHTTGQEDGFVAFAVGTNPGSQVYAYNSLSGVGATLYIGPDGNYPTDTSGVKVPTAMYIYKIKVPDQAPYSVEVDPDLTLIIKGIATLIADLDNPGQLIVSTVRQYD